MTNKKENLYRPTGHVLDSIVDQLLQYSHAKGDDGIKVKVEAAYEALKQAPFFPTKPIPLGLLGGPGQGKSAVCREAAKRVAAMLDLNFLEGANKGAPTKNDFYYDSITLGGAISTAPVKGHQIPTKVNVDGEETDVMRAVLPKWVLNAKQAGISFVVFDDLKNALSSVQTSTYDVLQEETSSDFGNAFYSWTGNLGDDGTPASKSNSAITSRSMLMRVKDDAEQFLERASKKFNDRVGTGLVGEYLAANPDMLNLDPAKAARAQTNFACSRTWENLIYALRPMHHQYLHHLSKQGSEAMPNLQQIRFVAEDICGPEVGEDFVAFVNRYISSAVPLVKQIMEKGEVDRHARLVLDEKYTDGANLDEVNFANTFSVAAANEAAQAFADANKQGDKVAKTAALKGLAALMYGSIPSREYINNTSRYFLKQVIVKSADEENVGWLSKTGAPVVRDALMEDIIYQLVKQPTAVQYVADHEGNDAMLVQVTFDGVIQATKSMVDEHKRLADFSSALKQKSNEARHAPKAKPDVKVEQKPEAEAVVVTATPADEVNAGVESIHAPVALDY